jgi:hypothetical protein
MAPRRLVRDVLRTERGARLWHRVGLWVVLLLAGAGAALPQSVPEPGDRDRIDLTGRQSLTLGSGARAYGMGGAFLARADDATAASWNPAGLSYLRLPEVSLVGNYSSFRTETGVDPAEIQNDQFNGGGFDFAALTWPIGIRAVRGAVQLSYQRAIPFDGRRTIDFGLERTATGNSNGGFDVLAFGTGLRLSRRIRAGFTVNRWLNGYDADLTRYSPNTARPARDLHLGFHPRGWNANLGLIWSPIDDLNIAGVFKTPFTADVSLDKSRADTWARATREGQATEVTHNAYSSDAVQLDFPSSFGFGVSWRPRDTLTVSTDYTQTAWSDAMITGYFDLPATPPTFGSTGPPPTPPVFYDPLPYPTLKASQGKGEQFRVGVEYVLIAGRLKIPLRAGWFSDLQITPNPAGDTPHFYGVTAGTGIILGSLLLDVAYLYEYGHYDLTVETPSGSQLEQPSQPAPTVRNSLKTQRFFVSLIYRFSGRP